MNHWTADDWVKIIGAIILLVGALANNIISAWGAVQSSKANAHAKAAVDLTAITNNKVDQADAKTAALDTKVDGFKTQVDGRMTDLISATKDVSFAAGNQAAVAQAEVKAAAFAAGQQSVVDQNMTADIAASPVHINGVQKVEIVQPEGTPVLVEDVSVKKDTP